MTSSYAPTLDEAASGSAAANLDAELALGRAARRRWEILKAALAQVADLDARAQHPAKQMPYAQGMRDAHADLRRVVEDLERDDT